MLQGLDLVSSVSLAGIGGAIEVIAGDPLAATTIAGRPVWLAAASFFQTNQRLLPDLIARISEEAKPRRGLRVADVYAGVGIFGLFLAAEAARVTIIEPDPIGVRAGRRTAEEWGLTNVRFLQALAGDALGEETCDVAVVDPPRSGLDPEALAGLMESHPPLVLYVSCLAESLARDLTALGEAGYEAEKLELFDFYPQTFHVELLAVVRLPGAS
jgi:tRNA/tmRNA/rRNA uracil-C5-methylase (TrmA/RlmC/RlmD family)